MPYFPGVRYPQNLLAMQSLAKQRQIATAFTSRLAIAPTAAASKRRWQFHWAARRLPPQTTLCMRKPR